MPYLGSSPARGLVGTTDIDDNAVTLAKMAGGTDGNLITYDASGDPAVVAAGTSGHFLKSQGAGSVPVFGAGPTAGMSLVQHQSITSSTAEMAFTNLVEEFHVLHLWNVKPVSDSVNLQARISADNGSSYATGSQYSWGQRGNDSGGTTGDQYGQNQTAWLFSGSEGTSNTASGSVYTFAFDRAKLNETEMLGHWKGAIRGASSIVDATQGSFSVHSIGTNDVDGIKFYFSSGNIATMEGSLFSVAVA